MPENQIDSSAAIPLVIGVTGHRDLVPEETTMLKEAVTAFFLQLRTRFPQLPLALISPLAVGADQLVAEVATELGIRLIALLPMPEQHYREDFHGDGLINFEVLLAKSEVIEVPLATGVDASTLATSRQSRNLQYIEGGGYLAAHSHILLTLWDGKDTGNPGGTSEVVRFHQHDTMVTLSGSQPLSPIDFAEDESDLVYHIACSRLKSGNPREGLKPGQAAWLTRDEIRPRTHELPVRYLTVFERMIEFNQELSKSRVQTMTTLVPPDSLATVSSAIMNLGQLFDVADGLASHYQRLMFRALWVGYIFVISAGLSFIVYADIYSHDLMIYAYLSSIAIVLIVFMFEERRGWQRKSQDYRLLAEALRVQFYWAMAGVSMDSQHRFAHDSFHQRRELELGWIRNVMRYAGRCIDAELLDAKPEAVETVVASWIGDEQHGQSHYYSAKAADRLRKNKMTTRLEVASFLVVILVAVTLVFSPIELPFANLLIALVGFMPFMVAVRQNYAHRTSERELISQYSYYYRIFANSGHLVARTDNYDTKRGILRALGKAALDENSQWIMRQRERPASGGSMMSG